MCMIFFFFFSSRRRHTRCSRDWSSDVCSSDLVIHGHAVPVEVDRCRERIQGTALGFRYHLIYVELQPCVDELVPRADPRELGREPGGHVFRGRLRQPPARASPIGSEPLERAPDPCLIGVRRMAGEQGLHQRSEEHTSELQSRLHLVCRLLLEKKKYNEVSTESACVHMSV